MRQVRTQTRARADIRALLNASRRRFGVRARQDYEALLDRALALLCESPDRAGVQRRESLPRAPFAFHLRHARQRGSTPKTPRHVVIFAYDDTTLYVLRVLHDAMDIATQLSPEEE